MEVDHNQLTPGVHQGAPGIAAGGIRVAEEVDGQFIALGQPIPAKILRPVQVAHLGNGYNRLSEVITDTAPYRATWPAWDCFGERYYASGGMISAAAVRSAGPIGLARAGALTAGFPGPAIFTLFRTRGLTPDIRCRSCMRQQRPSGSVRGVQGDRHSHRDPILRGHGACP